MGLMVSGGISWSKVIEVDPSFGQVPNPKPINNNKPKQKPVFNWQPKPSQSTIPLTLAQNQTHPHSKHSSQVPPSLPITLASTKASLVGSDKTEVKPTRTHMELTSTEKLLSVINNSDASVAESLCSDASVDESLCSDVDVALQRDIQRIIHEHTNNVIKKRGNSEQWVLELRDGRRVAVPIQISLPPGDVVDGVDDSNQLAMVLRVSSESKEIILEQEKGDDVVVEDWVSDICSKDAFQYTESLLPLIVEPLAFYRYSQFLLMWLIKLKCCKGTFYRVIARLIW